MKIRNFIIIGLSAFVCPVVFYHTVTGSNKQELKTSQLQVTNKILPKAPTVLNDTTSKIIEDKTVTGKLSEALQKGHIGIRAGLHSADMGSGRIGKQNKNLPDSPTDNVFHVQLENTEGITEAFLTYDLYGVKDHNSVSRGINDGLATGGAYVELDTEWKHQQEQIAVSGLKKGDNVVRFTAPDGSDYGYSVRNVGILVKTGKKTSKKRIVVNGLENQFYNNTAYISGFIPGAGRDENLTVTANGQKLKVNNGNFFGIIGRSSEIKTDSWNIQVVAQDNNGWTEKETAHYKKAVSATYDNSLTTDFAKAEIEAGAKDSVKLEIGGAILEIDTNALQQTTNLSITTLRKVDVMPTQSGLVNVTGKHAGFRMLPHGTTFAKPIRIGLPYDSLSIPNGHKAEDIRAYYFDEQKATWVSLVTDTIDTENHIAYAWTTHFTDFINGVVQVPESPETGGYTPTSIKGLKAADPSAGIVQISPPSANNRGSANLSFPIKTPSGRNGMQPQLAIAYSSAGGDGWLGQGWGLSVPSIGVETRWGVPRYGASLETETYLFSGEQLTPVAHRSEFISRTPDKQFYPRVEGNFSRIIRKGSSPSNYWWEVTTTTGVKYYYGSTDGTNVSGSHVLSDANGNIAEWKLAKVIDLNGNTMTYTYQSPTYTQEPLSAGKALYPKSINYTGHDNEPGNYNVNFVLKDGTKTDSRLSCNHGFPVCEASLLDQIEITYNNETVRSYQLGYIEGAYNKTLLQSVTELDADGEGFYTNSFDYFDEITDEGDFIPFKDATSINTKSDDLNGGGVLSLASSSAIGSHKGWNAGGGLYAAVGSGWNVFSKNLTVGGSYSYNHTESSGINTLIDLNGDRLVDKVFIEDNKMYYRPQNKDGSFASTAIKVNGGGKFNKSHSNSHAGGVEAIAYAVVGVSAKVTKSETENYFSDVNSDGLVDFIVNGKVRYNVLDADGHPSFTTSLSEVAIPTTEGGEIDTAMLMPDYGDWLEDVGQNPLNDMVRTWEAPYNGTISITGNVKLSQPSLASANSSSDGIIASIQVGNGKSGVLWADSIYSNFNATLIPSGVGSVSVSKGERVYFRLQSRFNGMCDRVNWSPTITYTDKTPKKDFNGLNYYSFNANDDYLLSTKYGSSLPVDGEVRIASCFNKEKTSDDVEVIYVLVDTNDLETIIGTSFFGWDSTFNDSIILEDIAVDGENQRLDIRVLSETEIDWAALKLNTKVVYSASSEPSMPLESLGESVFYPVPYFRAYNKTKDVPSPFTIPGNKVVSVSPVIKPVPLFPKAVIDGEVMLSIKRTGEYPLKKAVEIENGSMENDSSITRLASMGEELNVGVFTLDTLMFLSCIDSAWVSYVDSSVYGYNVADTTYTSGYLMLENLRPYTIWDDTLYSNVLGDTIFIEDLKQDTVIFKTAAGVSMHTPPDEFGANYRNWGQFSYMKGNSTYIDEDDLKREVSEDDINTDITLNENDSYDDQKSSFESQTGGTNQIDNPLVLLYASGETGCWTGYSGSISISPTQMGSGRRGESDLLQYEDLVVQEISEGSGKRAIIKKSKTNDYIIKAGIKAQTGGATGSYVNSTTQIQTDFTDMNGDGYPDLINGSKVQYSTPMGGLSSFKSDMGEATAETKTTIWGFSVNVCDPEVVKNTDSKFALYQAHGIGATSQTSNDKFTLMDINGDGLPDRLYPNKKVRLNYGYGFGEAQYWGVDEIRECSSFEQSAQLFGVGVSIDPETGELTGGSVQFSLWQGSFVAGIGASSNNSYATVQLMDVNGDGLTDQVTTTKEDDPRTFVRLNTGTGFAQEKQWTDIRTPNNQYSISTNANVAFTYGSPFLVPAKWVVNPQVQAGTNFNRTTEALMDIDGDGYPDYLASKKDNKLSYMASNYGKTNMLHTVNNALGSTITLEYEKTGNTYKMPQQAWVLTGVTTFDNHTGDGADYTQTAYEYGQGYYDRYERTFYGFDTLVSKQIDTENSNAVYRTIVQTFENGNYHTQGMQLSEELFDGEGNKFTESQNTYMFKDVSDNSEVTAVNLPEFSDGSTSWFPYLVETNKKFYEGQEAAGKTYRNSFEYDSYGNVTKYTDFGDETVGDAVIIGDVTYHTDNTNHIYAAPQGIEVTSGGVLYRKRETTIDGNGNLTEVRSYLSEAEYAAVNLEYDGYGNLEKKVLPENTNGERMFYAYVYDGENHAFVTKVSDAFGYSSSTEYDYRFGAVTKTTDMNSHPMTMRYDSKGRLTHVTGAKEIEEGIDFTIRYSYHPFATNAYALTEHYDPAHPDNLIETATFTDGLGRPVQVKKDEAIYNMTDSTDVEMMVVSGRVIYDAFGRTTETYQPITETKGTTAWFNTNVDDITPTTTMYDNLDRTLTATLPDGSATTIAYGFGNDRNGTNQFAVTATDALGNSTTQYSDMRGRQTSVTMPGGILLSTVYDPIGQTLEVTDHDGNTTTSSYDLLGRRLQRDHPDAGVTTWTYDKTGNMLTNQPAHIEQPITYKYEYNRLLEVNYPNNEHNDVRYEYGGPGADYNSAGRISFVEDATGAQLFRYGNMGELVKDIRTIVVPDNGTYAFQTEWKYDSWNRAEHIVYPDGEVLTYDYNVGGKLTGMSGKKGLSEYGYIDQVGYDKFGQRKYIAYGNNTQTTYNYDPERRWLSGLVTTTSSGRAIQDNTYAYDAVGNILQLANNAGAVSSEGVYGGAITHNYTYDNRYQLVSANGTYTGASTEHSYTLAMEYGNTGKILSKNQSNQSRVVGGANADWVTDQNTSYNYAYNYESAKPHAVTSISNATTSEEYVYQYDHAGNNISADEPFAETPRQVVWTEESRISAIKSNGNVSHYIYDATGTRVLKLHSNSLGISINGMSAGVSQVNDKFTMYPSELFVVKEGQYTKHFYVEGQRVLSKIGGDNVGEVFNQGGGTSSGTGGTVDYTEKQEAIENEMSETMEAFGLNYFKDGNGNIPSKYTKQFLLALELGYKVGPGSNGDDGYSGNDEVDGLLDNDPDYEINQYFFHPDHLGSSNYLTDIYGEVYQHLEYLPFGETFVEERNTENDQIPFLYNGKELDNMTGLYYYGARYYDPRDGIFLGVDPLAEKYPSISAYAYCANNPIRFIDLLGLEPGDPPTHAVKQDETIWRISHNYNMSTHELREMNGMKPGETLIKPGQQLKVRVNGSEPGGAAADNTKMDWGEFYDVPLSKFYDGFKNGIPYWGTNESGEDAATIKSKNKEQMEDLSPLTPSPFNIGNVFDFFKMMGVEGKHNSNRYEMNSNGTIRYPNGNMNKYYDYPNLKSGDTNGYLIPFEMKWEGEWYKNKDQDTVFFIAK